MTSMLQHLDELLGIKSGPMVIKSLLVLLAGCVAYYLTGALFGLLLRFLLPLRLKQTRRFKKPLALWGSLATSYFLMAFFLDYLLVLTPYFVTISSLLKVVASSWLLYDVGGLIIDFFSKKEGGSRPTSPPCSTRPPRQDGPSSHFGSWGTYLPIQARP